MPAQTPTDLAADLLFLLNQASFALATQMASGLADLGISPRDYCVLMGASSGRWTQSQLAEMSHLDKTTMVVTIDKLERLGLAERQASHTDRRARVIAVTPAGEKTVAAARKIVAELYDDVLGELPAGKRRVFLDSLVRLVSGQLATPSHVDQPIRRRAPQVPQPAG
ncbi:MarR family transcriptional regulator [Actinopolymorpha sp. B11F2]|uniref:MarR family winged helix-turn-helix transcriptional regulator n=1 Tax=Actinopolymorpha sp. B11F2 TaxID=3160862 RepID=UPI0032E3E84B